MIEDEARDCRYGRLVTEIRVVLAIPAEFIFYFTIEQQMASAWNRAEQRGIKNMSRREALPVYYFTVEIKGDSTGYFPIMLRPQVGIGSRHNQKVESIPPSSAHGAHKYSNIVPSRVLLMHSCGSAARICE